MTDLNHLNKSAQQLAPDKEALVTPPSPSGKQQPIHPDVVQVSEKIKRPLREEEENNL